MRCFNHPDKEAAGVCVVCGQPFCHACAVEFSDGSLFCRPDAACGQALVKSGPSTLAILALVLAIAGITNCVTGVAGVILGFIELDKIKKKQSPPEGRKFARAAVIVGIATVVLFALLEIVYLLVFARFRLL